MSELLKKEEERPSQDNTYLVHLNTQQTEEVALPQTDTDHNRSQITSWNLCLTSKHTAEYFQIVPQKKCFHVQCWRPTGDRNSLDEAQTEAGKHIWSTSRPTLVQGRGSCSRFLTAMFSWVLSISMDGNYTTSLGNLFHCLITLTIEKLFLIFRWNFLSFEFVLSQDTNEKSLDPYSSDSQYSSSQTKSKIAF